ncbi:MAG: FtsW/RodA/SpoVE family cell cycle protein [Planctomycetaceae bacterium]
MPDPIARERGILLSLTTVLVGFGVLMVYSAGVTSRPTEFARSDLSRHVVFLLLGIGLAAVATRLPADTWRRYSPHLFAVSVLLLIAVLVPGVGVQVNGARRWLRFGPASFQPSELAKLALPLLLARMLSNGDGEKPGIFKKPGFWRPLLPAALCVPLVALEPDLGTAVFLCVGCAIALFAGGWPLRNFFVSAGLLIPALLGMISLKSYQRDRITGFLAAWTDFEQAPYQLKQSILSLGAGGLFGVGIGKGHQKLSFLPEANTDFVFAVVGEELGLLGTLTVTALWIGRCRPGASPPSPVSRCSRNWFCKPP